MPPGIHPLGEDSLDSVTGPFEEVTVIQTQAPEHVPCLVEIPGGSHITLGNLLRFVNLCL